MDGMIRTTVCFILVYGISPPFGIARPVLRARCGLAVDDFPGLPRVGPGGLMPAMTVTFVMHPQVDGLEGIG